MYHSVALLLRFTCSSVLGGATPMDKAVSVQRMILALTQQLAAVRHADDRGPSMHALTTDPHRCANFTIVVILYGLFSNASVHCESHLDHALTHCH